MSTLKRILIFVAGFIVLNGAITLYFYKVSSANLNLNKFENEFRKDASDHINILYLGSSRSAKGLVRDTIQGLVSFATGGETSVQSYFKFRHLIEVEKIKIDTVVFPVGLLIPASRKPTRNLNSYYWSKYVDYLELGKQEKNLEPYISVFAKSTLFPWYEYPYMRLKLLYNEIPGLDKSIAEAYRAGDSLEKRNQCRKVVNYLMDENSNYTDAVLYYLEETILLCKKHGIKLIFIKYPISIPFKDVAIEILKKNEIDYLKSDRIINAHINDLTLLDYSGLFDNHPDYFGDMHHLNSIGSKHLTEIIRKELGWKYRNP
ncbi:MAG: hypothetical protein ACJAUJ_001732 [Salibacteraceae bacterium]|jgi:hypothetical protein